MSPPSSSSPFDRIPHETFLEILSRLSAEHLLQLKSVCKAWSSIISDQYFAHLQVKHGSKYGDSRFLIMNEPPSLNCSINGTVFRLLTEEWKLSPRLSFVIDPIPIPDFYDEDFSSTFHGYCNGLLCLSKRLDCDRGDKVYVCNPLTQESIVLPLVTEPNMYATYGLGVDLATHTYKVVNSYQYLVKYFSSFGDSAKVEVHTLGTNLWRKINSKPGGDGICETPVFAFGALHWKPCKPHASTTADDIADIVSFDMAQEVFYPTPRPRARYFQLAVHKERLAMFFTSQGNAEIWLLEGRGLQWCKTYSFILTPPPGSEHVSSIFGMWNNGEEMFFRHFDGYTCYYIKTGIQPTLDLEIPSFEPCIEVVGFIGSLLSPCMLNRPSV